MLLEGMFLPLTTPFTPDGRLNTGKLKDNVARYSKTPAAGLVALSRTGQPSLLSDVETRSVLEAVAETAATEMVLVAGVVRDSVAGTLELTEFAAGLGYDVVLVPVPSVSRGYGAAPEALNFYRTVADRSALPVIVDAGDERITEEAVSQLSTHTNIIGVLDCGRDAGRISGIVHAAQVRREVTVTTVFSAVTQRMLQQHERVGATFVSVGTLSGGGTALSAAPATAKSGLKTRTKTVGFQVLCGRTAGMLEALEAGAVGAVPPLGASAPQVCYEVLAAWKDGDPALAAEKQERLRLLAHRIESEMGVSGLVAGIKYGCDLNGYFGGRPRLPMLPLTGAEREEIKALMQGIRN